MNPLNLQDVTAYVEANIGIFHAKRLQKLEDLQLLEVLFRKNPYLFKAKNILTAAELVEGVLDAHLSSQEETLFGDFLEGLAVFINQSVYSGYKPLTADIEGIDLIFEHMGKLFIVEIKSGPKWGNRSQIDKMIQNFQAAKKALQPSFPQLEIVAVNGCCYGKDARQKKRNGIYWKLCGQDFWHFISGNEHLYIGIIEPLGHQAKQQNEQFQEAYARIINKFTLQFAQNFCKTDGAIDWEKIIKLVSERKSAYQFG